MKLILETDIGRDPDDFFCLLWLLSAGVDIKAVTVSPGDEDQISLVKLVLNHVLATNDIPVGAGKPNRTNFSVQGFHRQFVDDMNWPVKMKADGLGQDIIQSVLASEPDTQVLAIGPVDSLGRYLANNPRYLISRVTMQGGFVSPDIHTLPAMRLEKFAGKIKVPTFNLNGYKQGGLALINSPMVAQRRFCGKNVCHGVTYNMSVHNAVCAVSPIPNEPMRMIRYWMGELLKDRPGKVFHDPIAAVCHLYPEIGTWVNGTLYYEAGEWGTKLGGTDQMLVNLDMLSFWEHIMRGR